MVVFIITKNKNIQIKDCKELTSDKIFSYTFPQHSQAQLLVCEMNDSNKGGIKEIER